METRHLKAFAALVTGNRELLRTAGAAICCKCGERVTTDQIEQWIDEKLPEVCDLTAICPKCGADAMLPDTATEVARVLHNHWFN